MMTGNAQLSAHELELSKVFNRDFDFRIPEYQRPYSWQPEHARQLLDDLSEALDREDDEPYFLGSIVLVKDEKNPEADVIDGQQRLTTLTILLATLRDLSTNPRFASELALMIEEPGSQLHGRVEKPRLALRPRDAEFFASNVQKPGSTVQMESMSDHYVSRDSLRAIRDNTLEFRKQLQSDSWPESRREQLSTLLSIRTLMVVVTTTDLDSAYRIFSVMNARGLNLEPTDIFKSQLVGSIDSDDTRKKYAEKWEDAEAFLGRSDFKDLFGHIRTIHTKQRPQKVILSEFPRQVLNSYIKTGRSSEFVDQVLQPYSEAYKQICNSSYESGAAGADEVNSWLRRLNRINNSDWRPVALWALHSQGDNPPWLADILRLLERLAASMLIRRVYATPRAQRYAEVLRDLDEKGLGLASPALQLSSAEIRNTREILDGDVYLHANSCRYILLRLDESLADIKSVWSDEKKITIEHVLPQNPTARSQWTKTFSNSDRELWTHRLANLVLLSRSKNSASQNFDFDKKKTQYFTGKTGVATFALTTQVLGHAKWDTKVLEHRQPELLQTLYSEWQLQDRPQVASGVDYRHRHRATSL